MNINTTKSPGKNTINLPNSGMLPSPNEPSYQCLTLPNGESLENRTLPPSILHE